MALSGVLKMPSLTPIGYLALALLDNCLLFSGYLRIPSLVMGRPDLLTKLVFYS
jgi:hypothetical protein